MSKTLGKYEIIRTLGQGAMGEVYLAQQPAIGREVAIKTILQSAAKGEDAEDRFRREATAAGKLNHPNLVTIFDFDKDGDVLYLVMEFVKGHDLAELIEKKALSQSQYLEVLAQVCDGLSYAHRNGIIHRDIKPSNVRIIQDGKRLLAKVMDFGIARVEDSNMTATGIVMGTVSYMAPEYIRQGKATAQSDLFAVGVMLYECLAGRKPFAGDNTTTILFKIVSEHYDPIEPAAIQGISPSIRAVLDRALSKDPAQRFQSGDDLAKALRACMDPTWTGTVEEATTRISAKQMEEAHREAEALAVKQGFVPVPQEPGTVMLNPAVPQPPIAPTQMMPSQPAYGGAPTQMLPQGGYGMPPVQPTVMIPGYPTPTVVVQQAAPEPKGRGALYAVIGGLAVVIAAGGTWAVMSRREAPVQAAATPGPAIQSAVPVNAISAGPAVQPAASAPAQTPVQAASAPPPTAPPTATVSKPAAPAAQPQSAPAKAEPSKPEPPKPVEESFEQKLAKAEGMVGSDPSGASVILKGLVQAQPSNANAQGLYLACLLKTRRGGEFERAFYAAKGGGLNIQSLLRVPAFKTALLSESKAQRAKDGSAVLSPELMAKVTEGL